MVYSKYIHLDWNYQFSQVVVINTHSKSKYLDSKASGVGCALH